MPIDPRVALAAACRRCFRRSLLGAGAAGLAALAMPRAARAAAPTALDARSSAAEFGDVPLPLPIHELDKNHHHNVPPGPYTEPSEILNFAVPSQRPCSSARRATKRVGSFRSAAPERTSGLCPANTELRMARRTGGRSRTFESISCRAR